VDNIKCLPVEVHHQMTAVCHHAFPLSIILTEEEGVLWFLQHFTSLVSVMGLQDRSIRGFPRHPTMAPEIVIKSSSPSYNESNQSTWQESILFDYLESQDIYNDFLDIDHISSVDSHEILEYVVHSINANHYVCLYLDDYYLGCKKEFGICHSVQPILIYGYEQTMQKFRAVGFDINQMFSSVEVTYQELISGYLHAADILFSGGFKGTLLNSLHLHRRQTVGGFDLYSFAKQLGYYTELYNVSVQDVLNMNSRFRVGVQIEHGSIETCLVQTGVNVYRNLQLGLERLGDGHAVIDYKQMHLVYEHKLGLLRRLKLVLNLHGEVSGLGVLVSAYEGVVRQMQIARLKFLKYTYSDDNRLLTDIASIINETGLEERRIIAEIHDQLIQVCQK